MRGRLLLSGHTKLTCIIGDPVEHSLSPAIQNAAFEERNLDWAYVPMHVLPDDVGLAMDSLRKFFSGANVTMPYKTDVMSYMDELSSYAQLVGAVNTIKVEEGKLLGFNTDGRGFLNALEEEASFTPKGKNVAVVGSGGAGRSIACIMAVAGASKIVLANRTIEKAENLAEMISGNFKDVATASLSLTPDFPKYVKDCDLIINATPVGMKEDQAPFDETMSKKGQIVADLIYKYQKTKLLKDAESSGAVIMSGKAMLIHQGAASFEIWTGLPAPLEAMKKAMKDRCQ